MTSVSPAHFAFFNSSPEFALRCGHWACGCMDNISFNSCTESIEYYRLSEIESREREERERLREEAYQRELCERPQVVVVPRLLPVVQSMTVTLPTVQEKQRHHHRRPQQSTNGPCNCDDFACKNRHVSFDGHKCCTWVESKSHSCNSTNTHEVVINGITCTVCEVGLHRPGLNVWKP